LAYGAFGRMLVVRPEGDLNGPGQQQTGVRGKEGLVKMAEVEGEEERLGQERREGRGGTV
jgi:hypothetical protein